MDAQGGSSIVAREAGAILKAGVPWHFPGVFICVVGGSLLSEMNLGNSQPLANITIQVGATMQSFPNLSEQGAIFLIICRVPWNTLCKMLLWVRRLCRGSCRGKMAGS